MLDSLCREPSRCPSGYCGWYYPPTFLLIVLPLALVPYLWALAGWTLATLAAYLSVLRKIAPSEETVWLTLAFPGAWINLINGQNGFLTAALLGGGLVYPEQQPVLAGFLFGLLVIKPHLGIFVPLALVVSRRWTMPSCYRRFSVRDYCAVAVRVRARDLAHVFSIDLAAPLDRPRTGRHPLFLPAKRVRRSAFVGPAVANSVCSPGRHGAVGGACACVAVDG